MDLLELAGKGTGEDEASNGVARARGTVGVELTAFVALLNVELGQVTDTSDLDVGGRLEEVGTLDGTIGNEARAVARLHAPGHLLFLGCTDDRVGLGGCKEAKVLDAVDEDVLAARRLARGAVARHAVVPAVLTVRGVRLVGQVCGCRVGGEAQSGWAASSLSASPTHGCSRP